MNAVAALRRPWKIYRGWWIVLVGFLSLFISGGATGFGFSVLIKPMEADLGWNRTTLVGALTLASIVSGVLSAPLGPLFDKYGARFMMVASAFFGGASLILVAFARETWQYYALVGLGVGAARTALQGLGPRTAIANWFIRKRPAAFAVFASGTAVSGLVIVPTLAWIVANMSWRMAWVFMGLMEWILVVPLSWFFMRRRPEDVGLLPDGDKPGKVGVSLGEPQAAKAQAEFPETVWSRSQALRSRAYWFLVLGFLLTSFPASSIFIHMVPYFEDKGLTAAGAATALSIYALWVLVGRAIWGYAVARIGIHHSLTVYGLVYGAAIAVFTLAAGAPAIFATSFALGIAVGGAMQLQAQVWPDYFGRGIVGALTGFSTIMMAPSSAGGPLLAAFMYDTTKSYVAVFSFYSAVSFVAALFFFLARRPAPPAQQAHPCV